MFPGRYHCYWIIIGNSINSMVPALFKWQWCLSVKIGNKNKFMFFVCMIYLVIYKIIPFLFALLRDSEGEYTLTSHVVNAWISRLIVIIWGSETLGLWETQLQFFYFYLFQTSGYQRSLLSSGTTFFPEFLYVFSRRKQRIKLVFATSLVIKQILALSSFFFPDRMFIVPKLQVLKVVFFFFK